MNYSTYFDSRVITYSLMFISLFCMGIHTSVASPVHSDTQTTPVISKSTFTLINDTGMIIIEDNPGNLQMDENEWELAPGESRVFTVDNANDLMNQQADALNRYYLEFFTTPTDEAMQGEAAVNIEFEYHVDSIGEVQLTPISHPTNLGSGYINATVEDAILDTNNELKATIKLTLSNPIDESPAKAMVHVVNNTSFKLKPIEYIKNGFTGESPNEFLPNTTNNIELYVDKGFQMRGHVELLISDDNIQVFDAISMDVSASEEAAEQNKRSIGLVSHEGDAPTTTLKSKHLTGIITEDDARATYWDGKHDVELTLTISEN